MTEEKNCYNCGNKNCNVYYSMPKKDYKRHFEIYEYRDFDCVNHDKWEEMKVEEIRTDSTETLKNAKKMTEDEISKIKEHIEIHARREPRAIKITAIPRKAVDELERIAELEKENAELNSIADFQTSSNMDRYFQLKRSKEQLIKQKKLSEIIRLLWRVTTLQCVVYQKKTVA